MGVCLHIGTIRCLVKYESHMARRGVYMFPYRIAKAELIQKGLEMDQWTFVRLCLKAHVRDDIFLLGSNCRRTRDA